jgi:hypothetical protein
VNNLDCFGVFLLLEKGVAFVLVFFRKLRLDVGSCGCGRVWFWDDKLPSVAFSTSMIMQMADPITTLSASQNKTHNTHDALHIPYRHQPSSSEEALP